MSDRLSATSMLDAWRRSFRAAIAAASLAVTGACVAEPRGAGDTPYAEFGVFYGDQVQQRRHIPLELDPTRQSQGFRVRIEPPPPVPLEVRWEVGMPGQGQLRRDSRGWLARPRKAVLGRALWRAGERFFEQPLVFSPGDPLGLWSLRVLVGERTVLDRAFWVYDAAERAHQEPRPFAGDAGPPKSE